MSRPTAWRKWVIALDKIASQLNESHQGRLPQVVQIQA